jgi:hypothetical protein
VGVPTAVSTSWSSSVVKPKVVEQFRDRLHLSSRKGVHRKTKHYKRPFRECVKVSFRAIRNLCLEPVMSCSYQSPWWGNSKETLAVMSVQMAVDEKTEAYWPSKATSVMPGLPARTLPSWQMQPLRRIVHTNFWLINGGGADVPIAVRTPSEPPQCCYFSHIQAHTSYTLWEGSHFVKQQCTLFPWVGFGGVKAIPNVLSLCCI